MEQYILMNKNTPLATVTLSDAGYLTDESRSLSREPFYRAESAAFRQAQSVVA